MLIARGCSSVGRAPALQAGGHEFESHHLHVGNEPCLNKKARPRQVYLGAGLSFWADRAKPVTKKTKSSSRMDNRSHVATSTSHQKMLGHVKASNALPENEISLITNASIRISNLSFQ